MKSLVLVFFAFAGVFTPIQPYKIVSLPDSRSEDIELHNLKVFFSTKFVSVTHTVTSTITQHNYQTCYAADPGITQCQRRRSPEDVVQVELDGVAVSWESIISPSRVSEKRKPKIVG